MSRHSGAASYAFWLTVVAALFTSFYSWRLMFMTFHGKPRASAEVMSHVHESPPVMTVPLGILAASVPLFARPDLRFGVFIGDDAREDFWKRRCSPRRTTTSSRRSTTCRLWVKLAPLVMMFTGLVAWIYFYLVSAGDRRRAGRQRHDGLSTSSCSTSGTSTRLYDLIFVRPAKWLGRFLWKRGDGWLIDGFGPDGVSARVLDDQPGRQAADRICLPLRLRHADRRRRADHLVHVRGGGAMMGDWPTLLTIVTFLPLVGAASS